MKRKTRLFRKKNRRRIFVERRNKFVLQMLLVTVVGLALLWGGAKLVGKMQFFALKEIKIEGRLHKINQEKILEQLQVAVGSNLFKIDLNQLHQRLSQLKDVKSIQVVRKWPATLLVQVTEYIPSFVLQEGERYFYVDESGVVFKDITTTQDSKDFPFLTGIVSASDLEHEELRQKTIAKAVELNKEYTSLGLDKMIPISELNFDKNIGFTLYPEKKKYSIKIGQDGFKEKLSKLNNFVSHMSEDESKINSIDLNYSGKVLVKI